MHIGTVARGSGVSPKVIRYYESIGLVRAADRRANGYRSYSLVDMHTLNFIKRARSLGFSVDEVRELLDLWQDKSHTSAAVKSLATRHLDALDRKIEVLMAHHRSDRPGAAATGLSPCDAHDDGRNEGPGGKEEKGAGTEVI